MLAGARKKNLLISFGGECKKMIAMGAGGEEGASALPRSVQRRGAFLSSFDGVIYTMKSRVNKTLS